MSVCGDLLERVATYLHSAESGDPANGLDRPAGEPGGATGS